MAFDITFLADSSLLGSLAMLIGRLGVTDSSGTGMLQVHINVDQFRTGNTLAGGATSRGS
jgi:hypothetical protein